MLEGCPSAVEPRSASASLALGSCGVWQPGSFHPGGAHHRGCCAAAAGPCCLAGCPPAAAAPCEAHQCQQDQHTCQLRFRVCGGPGAGLGCPGVAGCRVTLTREMLGLVACCLRDHRQSPVRDRTPSSACAPFWLWQAGHDKRAFLQMRSRMCLTAHGFWLLMPVAAGVAGAGAAAGCAARAGSQRASHLAAVQPPPGAAVHPAPAAEPADCAPSNRQAAASDTAPFTWLLAPRVWGRLSYCSERNAARLQHCVLVCTWGNACRHDLTLDPQQVPTKQLHSVAHLVCRLTRSPCKLDF